MKKLIGSDLAKAAAMVCALALAACGTEPDEKHPEAVKVELRLSGQVIASYVAETGRWTGEPGELEVDVGEETGELDTMLLRIADAYEVQVDRRLDTFFRVLEPIILIFMAVVIGALLFAMILPMTEMMKTIGSQG